MTPTEPNAGRDITEHVALLAKRLDSDNAHWYDDELHDESRRLIQALADRVRALEAALEPFAHPDLSARLAGNIEGVESPVFGRNNALLRIKHFEAARAALRSGTPSEEGTK